MKSIGREHTTIYKIVELAEDTGGLYDVTPKSRIGNGFVFDARIPEVFGESQKKVTALCA